MILYISGPISSNMTGYKAVFSKAEEELKRNGHIVLNPAIHPLGMPYESYLKIDLTMVNVADGIVMLHGWKNSNGAMQELRYAMKTGKKIFYGVNNVPCAHNPKCLWRSIELCKQCCKRCGEHENRID